MRARLSIPALLAASLTLAGAEPPASAWRRALVWAGSGNGAACQAQILVEEKPARTLRCKGPADDLLLLVVLDLTGDLTLITEARDALVAEIERLPANTWVGVLTAQDGLRVIEDPSADRARVIEAIRNARATGAAGLLAALEPASRLTAGILARAPVRVAILHVTDSNIYGYREDYTNPVINPSDARDLSRRFPDALVREKTAKLAASLSVFDAPVFVVHLAYLRDRLNEAYQTGLSQIAEATGGRAGFCRSQADIAGEIESAFLRIAGHYAIDFEVPPGAPSQFSLGLKTEGTAPEYRSRYTLRPK